LAGYPAIFSIRPDIRQVESGIHLDIKKAKLSGMISGAFLLAMFLNQYVIFSEVCHL
jgi:hypothetical protein